MEEPRRKRRRTRRRCKKHPKEGPHSPNCRGFKTNINNNNNNTSAQSSLVKVLPTLKPILNFLNIKDEVFTRQQIMAHLTEYIKQKSLFDPKDPRKVYCQNDQLALIFGCSEFSTANACELLLQNLESVPEISEPAQYSSSSSYTTHMRPVSTTDTCSCSESDQQGEPSSRYYSTETGNTTTKNVPVGLKRSRNGSCSDGSNNTEQPIHCGIYFSPLHKNFLSDESGEYSRHYRKICDNTTDVVTDTTDDLYFLEESDRETFVLPQTDEERFTEYEPITFSEEEHLEALSRQFEGEADTDIESGSSSAVLIDDGDDGGDELGNESDNDSEIEEDDKWNCESCSERNHPMIRNCRRCWQVRKDWYPTSLERSHSDPILLTENTSKKEEAFEHVSDTASSNLTITQNDDITQNGDNTHCIVCLKEPRNGCIIHGQTGHQVCCVKCAKQLKKQGRKCPVCRKRIHKVITNFT